MLDSADLAGHAVCGAEVTAWVKTRVAGGASTLLGPILVADSRNWRYPQSNSENGCLKTGLILNR